MREKLENQKLFNLHFLNEINPIGHTSMFSSYYVSLFFFFFSFYSKASKVFFLLGEREYLSVAHLVKITVSSDIKA